MRELILVTTFFLASSLRAEQGYLVIYATDTQGVALSGVQLTVKGDGGVGKTVNGKARIRLAAQTQAKSWVTLGVTSPTNLVFVSPWDERAQVPSFENESQNYISVVLAERSDRRLFEDPAALRAMVQRANQAAAPTTAGRTESPEEQHKRALEEVAKTFGLEPAEIDSAIRAWGQKAVDPYDKGLAELYGHNYAEATPDLEKSVAMRKQKAAKAEAELVDADVSLGQSLFGQAKYRQAAESFKEADQHRQDDTLILSWLGLSLQNEGDYPLAEQPFRRALGVDENAAEPRPLRVARDLNNLAALLVAKGDYAGAEPLFRRALETFKKVFGPEHPDVATAESNLAALLGEKGDYVDAEPLYRSALGIDEKALGAEHPDVATRLNNLAWLLFHKGDYAGAEPLFRRALAIGEKTMGPEHPDVATRLNNLAEVLRVKGDYADAEPLYRRAIAIIEKTQGPEHPSLAMKLNNLAVLLDSKGDSAEAELLYRRALTIDEKALGPSHPGLALGLNNFAEVLRIEGNYVEAEPLYRRALAIDEKALGPNNPATNTIRSNLQLLLNQKANPKPK